MSRNFDGSDDLITSTSSESLDDLPAYTIVVWMYNTGLGTANGGYMYSKNPSGSAVGRKFNHDDFNVDYTLVFTANSTGSSGNPTRRTSNNFFVENKWYGMCATWDGSLTAANIHIYKLENGVFSEATYQTSTDGITAVASDAADTVVIGNRVGGARSFDGSLAFMQVWARVLSNGEMIQALLYPGSIMNNLRGFWPLWGSSSIEPDLSGNGNHGTVTGAIKGLTEPPINGIFQVPRPELIHVG